jgi:hypothetical protein
VPIEGVGWCGWRGAPYRCASVGPYAADLEGHIVWRQGLTQAGDLTTPLVIGPYLVFRQPRRMFIVDRDNGTLLEIFNPGGGFARPLDPSGTRLTCRRTAVALRARPRLRRAGLWRWLNVVWLNVVCPTF